MDKLRESTSIEKLWNVFCYIFVRLKSSTTEFTDSHCFTQNS